MKNVLVVGGGASGLMAAYSAAKNGHNVTLIEKNEKLGKKIYITGKGRCNFTNNVPVNEFLPNVVHNSKFMTGALYSFTPQDVMEFMERFGTKVKTERGNRAFPISDHASDITKALQKACESVGVKVHLNEKVLSIKHLDNTMFDVITDKMHYNVENIVICTGGLSYPTTGSDGDGYKFAKMLSHKVTPLYAALTGLNLAGNAFKQMQGLSLKNVCLRAERGNKVIYSAFGEMLFTHYGISGPIVLTLSSDIARENVKDISLYLDLKPALSDDQLDKRILRDFSDNQNKNISNVLPLLIPSKMLPSVLAYANISERKAVNSVTKEERANLVKTLKNYPMKPTSLRGFDEAIITSGGVDVKEINPKTMESKICNGLYFCGEVLDVDAYTGGFNLQIAFSTGYAAGNSIE